MDIHAKAKEGMFGDKSVAEADMAAKQIHKINSELGQCTLIKVIEEQSKEGTAPRFAVPDHLQKSFAKLYGHDTISVAPQQADPVVTIKPTTLARDEFGRETAVFIQRMPSPEIVFEGKATAPRFSAPTKLVELNYLDPKDEIPLEDGCGSLVEQQVDTRPINMNEILTKHKNPSLQSAPSIGIAGVTNALQRTTGSSKGWEVHHPVQMGTLSIPKPQWVDPKVVAEQRLEKAKSIEQKRALATEEAKRRIAERNEERNAKLRKAEQVTEQSAARFQHLLTSIDVPEEPIAPLPAAPPKKTVHDLLAKKKGLAVPAAPAVPAPQPVVQETKVNSLAARIQAAKKVQAATSPPKEPIMDEPEPCKEEEVEAITTAMTHLSTKRERSPTAESPPPEPKRIMLPPQYSPLPSNLGKVSIAKLREYCIQREIDSSGTKKDIIERLKNFE